jgi:hypothetical protein
MTWRITPYVQNDADRSWTEYAIDDEVGGPICSGIQTKTLAEQIARLGNALRLPVDESVISDMAKAPDPQEALIDRLGLTLEDLLAEVRHIRAQAGERISSATVKTSTRGTDLECKSYADGQLGEALDEALAQYARGMRQLEALQMNGWKATVEATAERQ